MPTDLTVARARTDQPDPKNTKKSQKRYQAEKEYNAEPINSEFDFIHETINNILVEDPAIDDQVTASATAATNATAINSILSTLRKAGLLKT